MGASTRIGRRVYTTHVCCIGYDAAGREPVKLEADLLGHCRSIDSACSKARRQLDNKNIVVTEYESTSKYYSMPIAKFVKYADKVSE